MIVSCVCEERWVESLAPLPLWDAGRPERVLVVAPHPDDETLGAGGLIAAMRSRGVEVEAVCVTDGENAYPDEPDSDGLAGVRREEQASALSRLGLGAGSIVRLGLVDSGVSAQEWELEERLTALATAGTMIVAPWEGDFHPDHEACGRAAATAAKRTGARLISYFFWTWHRGEPEMLEGLRLVKFSLTDGLLRAKTEALAEHASQLYRTGGEAILPENLLEPARRDYEVFALR